MKKSIFNLFIVFILLLFSCTERARLNLGTTTKPVIPIERVVIIEYNQTVDVKHHYKVRRIEKGVIEFIDVPYLYAKGDTIFHQF